MPLELQKAQPSKFEGVNPDHLTDTVKRIESNILETLWSPGMSATAQMNVYSDATGKGDRAYMLSVQ